MKINIIEVKNNELIKTNEIIFDVKGGDFLSSLEEELNISKKKDNILKDKLVIKDIQIFPFNNIQSVKEKISVVSGILPNDQFIYYGENNYIGYDYIIDGIKFDLHPKELINYNEKNNTLFKYKGVFKFLDLSTERIEDIKELNVIKRIKGDNEIINLFYKKFWPFDEEFNIYNYEDYVLETKIYKSFNDDVYSNNIILTDKITCCYNSNIKQKLNLMDLASTINLKKIGAGYCHLKTKKHLIKYIDKYKIRKEFDMDALNIYLFVENIPFTMSIFSNGRVKITMINKLVRLDFIEELIEKKLPEIIPLGDLKYGRKDILLKYNISLTKKEFSSLKSIKTGGFIRSFQEEGNKLFVNFSKDINEELFITIENNYRNILVKIKDIKKDDTDLIISFFSEYFIKQINVEKSFDIDISKINTNKRLFERDPVAYPKMIPLWSRKCQKKNQPIIFNEEEYENLPDDTKSKSVKYYNFTTGEDAYYYCNCEKFPNISFKEYFGKALPCCQLSPLNDDVLKDILKTKTFSKQTFSTSQRYELGYKLLEVEGRSMKLPNKFNNIFDDDIRVMGVNQNFGLLGSYIKTINLDISDITDRKILNTIKGGEPILDKDEWNHLLINYFIKDINLVIIEDDDINQGENFSINRTKIDDKIDKFILVLKQGDIYNPLVKYNTKNISIVKSIWYKEDIDVLLNISRINIMERIYEKNIIINKIFVKKNLINYILISNTKKEYVCLPLNVPVVKKYNENVISQEPISLKNLSLKKSTLEKFLGEINLIVYEDTIILDKNDDQIGFIHNNLIYHFSPEKFTKKENVDYKIIRVNYDIYDVYKCIYENKNPNILNKKKETKESKNISDINDFINKYYMTKNKDMRKKITDIMSKSVPLNIKLFLLKEILDLIDYEKIKEILLDGGNINDILSTKYLFDDTYIYELSKKDIKDISKLLKKDNGYSEEVCNYLSIIIKNPLLRNNIKEVSISSLKTMRVNEGEKIITLF